MDGRDPYRVLFDHHIVGAGWANKRQEEIKTDADCK